MKKILTLICFAPLCAFSATLNHQLATLIAPFSNTSVGVLIQDQTTGKVLFKKNENRYFMPASNEKLFTAYGALQQLGSDFTYKTQLFADKNKIVDGVLHDDVTLKFSGDPTLTSEQLNQLITSVADAGVKTIEGNLVIDDSAFDQMTMSLGTTWDDQDYCWGSPISALIIDHNCVRATLTPAQINQAATLTLPSMPQSSQFVSHVITANKDKENCAFTVNRVATTSYAIEGCVKADEKPHDIEMAIANPRTNSEFILKHLLQQHHIALTGTLTFAKNTHTTLLAQVQSNSLPQLISVMLKDSDNTIANALFKSIGAAHSNTVGTFENGSDAVRAIVKEKLNIDIPKTTLIDGNGGSRYDYVTPQQLVKLLKAMSRPDQKGIFVNGMAISGVDGTLKDRLNQPQVIRHVIAKTGSMTAVSALAGYLQTKKKHHLIFSIMINGFVDQPARYLALEDQICRLLIAQA